VLPSVRREVFHPYSDRPEGGIWANCYVYEEAFGEKLRALGERTRPRDLYDVVNLYRHTDSRPSAAVLLDVLQQKCAYKALPVPTFQAILPHRPALEAMWANMLSHQLPVLPPLNDFWGALPEIFNWMMSGTPIPQRALIQHGVGEVPVSTRVLPMNIPLR
jgi:predicted nucleotidyltransferase component of viral defense system